MGVTIHVVYCPRCHERKKFVSTKSREKAISKMEDHVKRAHPDMVGWDED